ncbi:hypothetical protein YC2023_045614 [Brassica napus]
MMVVEEIFLMVEVMLVKWKINHVVDGEGKDLRRSDRGGGFGISGEFLSVGSLVGDIALPSEDKVSDSESMCETHFCDFPCTLEEERRILMELMREAEDQLKEENSYFVILNMLDLSIRSSILTSCGDKGVYESCGDSWKSFLQSSDSMKKVGCFREGVCVRY